MTTKTKGANPLRHVLTIKYDETFDHFLIQGGYSFVPNVMVIDGYEAAKLFRLYLDQMMHEIEDVRRLKRVVPIE